jgi:hypothetical protein
VCRDHVQDVSFDIYLRAFADGDAVERNASEARHLLLASSDEYDAECRYVHVVYGDGEADGYGIPAEGAPLEGLMFNHVAGDAFDLIVAVARRADLVVAPVGCPICIVSETQRAHLPADLAADGVELVLSGRDLAAVIARA